MYWSWPIETGSTQAQINNNDELDSEWIGDSIILGVQATGRQVNENPLANQYAVILDANGGTINEYGNSSQMTKQVTYGETYGALPTPSRPGYVFKGWNGKNIINMQAYWNSITNVYHGTANFSNNSIEITASERDAFPQPWRVGQSGELYKMTVKPNTQYVLSWKSEAIGSDDGIIFVFFNGIYTGEDNPTFVKAYNSTQASMQFTTKSDTDFISIRFGVIIAGSSIRYYDVQIEEGLTATAYEPYYITSSTEVVQTQNHTLTAIWEPAPTQP